MYHYDDDEPQQKPPMVLRDPPQRWVQANCPYCPNAVFVGLSDKHAADLLAIHQEACCPGPRGPGC